MAASCDSEASSLEESNRSSDAPPNKTEQNPTDDFSSNVKVVFDETGNTLHLTQYVRTRHNNLRCFPRCSDPHSPSSFCGQSLTGVITFTGMRGLKGSLSVVGGFKNRNAPPVIRLNEVWNRLSPLSDSLIVGSCIAAETNRWRFIFTPSRKWQYATEDRVIASETHMFTVYVLEDLRCISIVNSNPFHVTPIWTAERDKESQRRTKARMKRKEALTSTSGGESDGNTDNASPPTAMSNPPPYATINFQQPFYSAQHISTHPPMQVSHISASVQMSPSVQMVNPAYIMQHTGHNSINMHGSPPFLQLHMQALASAPRYHGMHPVSANYPHIGSNAFVGGSYFPMEQGIGQQDLLAQVDGPQRPSHPRGTEPKAPLSRKGEPMPHPKKKSASTGFHLN